MKINQIVLFAAIALAPLPALAAPITYFFSVGTRAASAQFTTSGTDLILTLTNTSTYDALVPTDVLGGVFFNIVGDPLLTRTSAIIPIGSSALVGGTGVDVTPGDRVVGGEWAYNNSIGAVPPENAGVSSVGLGVFGPGDLFPGLDLQPPLSPDGIQYGITSAGDNLLTGNGGITGPHLIKNSVVFTLGGFTGNPATDIVSATFQYGTSLDEPQFEGSVPEPASILLLALGGAVVAARGWRRRTSRIAVS